MFWDWINRIPEESEKLKRRFSGSENTEDKKTPPTNLFGIIKRFDFLHFLYRFTSYYGESWRWAITILFIGVLLIFPIIYTQTDFQNCPKDMPVSMSISECKSEPEKCKCKMGGLDIWEAVRHSLASATFQTVEYRKPITGWGEFWITLEKILAPLQSALLALAIRRKFMR